MRASNWTIPLFLPGQLIDQHSNNKSVNYQNTTQSEQFKYSKLWEFKAFEASPRLLLPPNADAWARSTNASNRPLLSMPTIPLTLSDASQSSTGPFPSFGVPLGKWRDRFFNLKKPVRGFRSPVFSREEANRKRRTLQRRKKAKAGAWRIAGHWGSW